MTALPPLSKAQAYILPCTALSEASRGSELQETGSATA